MRAKYVSAGVALLLAQHVSAQLSCSQETFAGVSLPRGEILSVVTELNNTLPAQQTVNTWPIFSNTTTLTCKVTIQHTHPGWNDTVTSYVWLPSEEWNGRFVGVGGGGWAGGRVDGLGYHVARGYAAVTTDGGHAFEVADDLEVWAHTSKGNINWYGIQNFAAVALDDATTLGKAVVEAFYGSGPDFSYWTGCSTGGRQGLMLAQRYPEQYDGILATCPAINWDRFLPAMFWPPFAMSQLDYYPPPCELEAITKAAVEACDAQDGLEDGVVAWPGDCDFDATTVVGQRITCENNSTRVISDKGAQLANMFWKGPVSEEGVSEWYGLYPSAPMLGTALTVCSSETECEPAPFSITTDWIQFFLLQDPEADLSSLTHEEFSRFLRMSTNRYSSVIGTSDVNLKDFKRAGGKIISWHGADDELIPFLGTAQYYRRVLEADPNAADFFRFFSVPGVQHCAGGEGWFPGDALDSLVDWVENGNAPDILVGRPRESIEGEGREAPVCQYPKKLRYLGGDPDVVSSFECQ
ncbi:Tannase/feruloyl esterase [Stachybotrys elegans]|uniref:Carboxylic ester hydrolase n=1 Tax=Stachybotrys elegans TaxID=80388 RepID=A0A8K0SQV1_9HYPO|nr:Tannase/feruloyl esterase [Stachybotrys elegans]